MSTTTTRPSPAARRWADRIDSGEFTHGQIRSFAYLPARMADGLDQCGTGAHDTTLRPEEARVLVAALSANPVGIPDGLSAIGLRWLRNYAAERLPGFPVERLADFERYSYAGEHAPVDPWRSVPVWRVHFADGGPFLTYAVTSARCAHLSGCAQTPGNWTEGAW